MGKGKGKGWHGDAAGHRRAALKRGRGKAIKNPLPIMKGESSASAFRRIGSNFSPKMLKAIRKAQKEHKAAVAKIKTGKTYMHTVRRWTSKGNYRGPQI